MKRIALFVVAAGGLTAGCNAQPPASVPTPRPAPMGVQVAPVAPAVPDANNVEQVVAKQGVGIKGRSLDQHEGIIVTPAKSLFAVKERVVFDIAIPQAMNLYQASNGQGPQTHDEFMQHIIAENNIKLPLLAEGESYVFNVESQQLMVKRPKRAESPAPPPK